MNRKKLLILFCLLTVLGSSLFLARCGSGLSGVNASGTANGMKM
jgi:hypothetical protein